MTRGSNLNGYLENSLESEETMLHNRGGVINDRERDLNMYRSGSAPPTMEGSLNALGSIFGNLNFAQIDSSNSTANGVLTEEEIQSHPVYLSYYYSHHNINPRLPPPLFSKEDWRVGQRFQAGGSSFGGSGDWRKKNFVDDGGSSSLFSMQPAEDELMELRKDILRNLSRKNSVELLDRGSDGFIGTSVPGMGVRRKGFADILQKGLNQPDSQSDCLPASHNAFHDIGDTAGISKSQSAHIRNGAESTGALHDGGGHPGLSRVQNLKSAVSNSFASALGSSLSRSGTPDPHLSWRSPSPNLLPVGSRVFPVEKNNFVGMKAVKGLSSSMTELVDVAASLSNLSLEKNRLHDEDNLIQSQLQRGFDKQSNHVSDTSNGHRNSLQQQFIDKCRVEKFAITPNCTGLASDNGVVMGSNVSKSGFYRQMKFSRRTSSSTDLHTKMSLSGFVSLEGSNMHYQDNNFPGMDFSCHEPIGYSASQKMNTAVNNHLGSDLTNAGNGQNLRSNQAGFNLYSCDPRYVQYSQRISDYASRSTAGISDPSEARNYFGTSHEHGDLQAFQKACLQALLTQQKQHNDFPHVGKSGSINHRYCRDPGFGLGMPYQGTSMPYQNEPISRFPSMLRSSVGGSTGSWDAETGINMEERFASSLLEELKNNKTRSLELLDVVDHVVEFSMDQYGSRFLQQKLETATTEEKNKIFPEIIPHALGLITDVFGNYVIQKFFYNGTERQRKELADKLTGHILPLSLQMYGCRVIQKALEVIDVDQQTQMVAELDGSVMKCVHDQNGNHVIQKCIECIPQNQIRFIISAFFGKVASLFHPSIWLPCHSEGFGAL